MQSLSPVLKLALLAHITFSVGWLGSVASFLALSITGLTSTDTQTVRAAYLTNQVASTSGRSTLSNADLREERIQLVVIATAALLALIVCSLAKTSYI